MLTTLLIIIGLFFVGVVIACAYYWNINQKQDQERIRRLRREKWS